MATATFTITSSADGNDIERVSSCVAASVGVLAGSGLNPSSTPQRLSLCSRLRARLSRLQQRLVAGWLVAAD